MFSMFYCPTRWCNITEGICKDLSGGKWTSNFPLIYTGFLEHKNPLARHIT